MCSYFKDLITAMWSSHIFCFNFNNNRMKVNENYKSIGELY